MDSIDNIYLQFHKDLSSFIRSRVPNDTDAEDILHDVFLKVQTRIGTLYRPEKIKSWLFQICRNTIIDYYRKTDRTIELNETIHRRFGESGSDDSQEIDRCLLDLVDSLKEDYRRAVMKADIENKPMKLIAEEENISLSGIKSRVRRGREQLRTALNSCCRLELDSYGRPLTMAPQGDCGGRRESDC